MSLQDLLISIGGGAGVVGTIAGALKSKRFREAVRRLFSASMLDLTETVRTLQTVVEAQGESIEWLRTELSSTKSELDVARLQLAKTESLAVENIALRSRIADLEAQVQRLEEELKRRRGGRPKTDG
jgi:predicted RNase H-like nuclease (RuvC/YqgF family)